MDENEMVLYILEECLVAKIKDMNSDYIKNLKEFFDMFDVIGSNQISLNQFGSILRALEYEFHKEEVEYLFNEANKFQNLYITFEEFMLIPFEHKKLITLEQELYKAFRSFDREGNGKIASKEFKHIMITLGERFSEEFANEIMKDADPGEIGEFEYKNFIDLMCSYI